MKNEKGKLYYGLGLDNDQLRADASESRNIIKGIGDTTAAEGARIDNAYRKIAGTVAAVFTVQQAAAFAKSIVQVRGEIESLEVSFETLLGNKQKANALFSEIKTYAVNTPMQMNDLAKGAQMLLSFNVEAERIMPILKQIGDISMGDAQKFNSLTLAFSQMSSTGKLMGQDLLQMINAGFNPLSVMSEKTGKSIGQLKKDMEGGLITSQMVADAFAAATSEGGKFYGMLDKQSKGINGSMSNLEGAITDMFNDLGTANQGFITDTIQGATTAVQHYKEIGEALAVIVATYGTYKAVVMATEAVQRSIETVKRTEEAAELMKLLSVEQQAKISKLGLAKTSVEYAAAVKAEVAANVQGAQSALTKARADVVAANQSVVARREEYIAAKQLESQRLAELMSIGATGSAKQVEAAQRKLSAAEMQRESAALAFQSASRDFNAKKTAVETAARTANTTATAANTAVQTANVTATGILSVAKTRLTAVAARLNAVIMANPYALAAAAVMALVYGIYKLVTYQTDAEKAQTKLNDAIKETNKNIDSEIHQIDSMFARLKNAKQGTDEYRAAKEAIMNRYGEYLKKLGDEKTALNDVAAAYELITEEAKKAARARAMESFTKEAADTLAEKDGDSKDKVRELLDKKYKGKKGSDGISLSETYYWKIKPVIEGESEITPEIEKILKEFDKVGGYMSGGSPTFGGGTWGSTFGGGTWVSTVSNSIKDEINKAAKARGIYGKAMSEAQMKFGENPNANAPEAPKFDATTASLQQLMEQLPKAKDELDALNKADKPDPAVIAAKEREIQQIKNQTAAREKSLTVIKDVKAQIELLQKEQEKYGKNDTEYTALETRIKSLKTKLPQTEGQANKTETDADRLKREIAERAKRIKEYEEAAKLQDEQAELNIRQAKLDCTEDSYEKEQEQNALLYDRLILTNKKREAEMVKELRDARELQWENKNPKAKAKGETFDRSTVTAADLSSKQKAQLTAYEKFAAKEKEKANQALLEKLIADFGTYEQKRAAIAEKWEKKIASLPEEYRKEARRQMIEEIAALDEESKKKTAILTKLFGNMSKKAVKDIRAIADEAQRMIDYISEGEFKTDVDGNGLFGLTKEQFDMLSKSPEKLQAIKDAIANVNKKADEMSSAFDKVGDGITKMFNAKGDSAEFKDGLTSLAEGLGEIKQALDFISDSFSKLGEAFDNEVLKKISEGINIATDAMSSAMEGAFAGFLIGGPIGAGIGAALGLFSSLAAAIAKIKDAKNEEQIQQMQNQIDTLEKSYELLDKTINKAYSNDASRLIEQQNTLLEQQKVLIQNQIAEEEAKKNSDKERINEWRGQIDDINRTITDNKEKAIDAIFGEDLKTAIDNFAAAYANAWTSNEDRVKSARDTIRDMMRQMVTESIKAAIQSSNKMEEIRSKLQEFYSDGILTDWEQKYVYKMGEELQSELDNKFGWADSLMKDEKEDTREASAKGIAAASQDSVNELNGRMTAVQGHTFLLSENSKILVANSNRVLDHLAGIEDNTRNLSRLEAIETGVRELKRSIDDISLKGIKIK